MKISLKAAHQLAKTFEGDYRACLALAMIQLWAEAKAPKATPSYFGSVLAVEVREKSIFAYIPSGYGERKVCFPKSQLVDLTNGAYGVPRWLWMDKGGSTKFRNNLPFDWSPAVAA